MGNDGLTHELCSLVIPHSPFASFPISPSHRPMKVFAKTEYAASRCLSSRTLTTAANRSVSGTLPIDMASPRGFLVQILLQLKGAGLVQSTRGAAGGYQLASRPRTSRSWK